MKFKNNAVALDLVDLKILEALEDDAKQTYAAIGKTLGMAHSTVYDRVKRMEQHGIIKKYTAIVDAERVGARNIMAMMTIFTDPKESEKVAKRLCKAPEILEVYTSLSEELVIIAKVVAGSQEGLHEFIARSVAPMPGVLRIRTSTISKKFKEERFSIVDSVEKPTLIKRIDSRVGENTY